ncbi:hypothetical protein [Ammoniphilus sp. YIM 78166]|uniref:hypothetical protein n=1 Tax=Ammoniphilus sp. YIM 78166 TaxID=1644106 RepID=UPI00107003D7|nr:hypothetical protein [Ammoniphilus sp. YIM 78166]
MRFVFKPELPPVPQDKWYNAAVKLKEIVGEQEFTVHSIISIFKIDGNQAMTFLSYLMEQKMIEQVYE